MHKMSRNIYDIKFENEWNRRPTVHKCDITPSFRKEDGGEDRFCNRTLQIPQHNTDICNKKLMLRNSSSSAFNRSNPKQAPYDNQRSERNMYIPLKKIK